MISPSQLVVGNVYFMPTYQGSDMKRLVILSLLYLGQYEEGAPNDVRTDYHFEFLPPFQWHSGLELPKEHILGESNLSNLFDADGLIREIQAFRNRASD